MQLFLKILSGIANSVDPDKTALGSGSTPFAYAILTETLVYEILRYLPQYPVLRLQMHMLFRSFVYGL